MSKEVLAWHWLANDRKLRDGSRVVEAGYVYTWTPDGDEAPCMCRTGLHASERVLDALQYAPGNVVSRVICRNVVATQKDKLLCTEREVLWVYDAGTLLREFARWCALQVIDKWDAPEVVVRYLKTGDESIRAAAWAAARAAAWDAARAAAWAAQDAHLTAMLMQAGCPR